jgi:DNA-binding beta-propeller fold protein YncE
MVVLAGLALALPALVAASAQATGALQQLEAVHGRALDGARGVAVSPDGRNVYVAAAGPAGGVAAFARDAKSGKLTQLDGLAGCVTETGAGGCSKARAVKGAASLAISPDGKTVYVVSFDLAILARNPKTGALTQLPGTSGCLGATAGCGQARALFGGNVGSVAVSPDGKTVYVGSHQISSSAQGNHDNGAVAIFDRSAGGALKQLAGAAGCVSNGGSGGCRSAVPLGTVGSLAVSPDGKNVYAGSETNSEDFPAPSAILTFARAADGSLTARSCVARSKRPGCIEDGAIFTPTSLAVSHDGKNVYATALQTQSVTTFARGTGGALKPLACIGASFAGCKTDNGSLLMPTAVALPADGTNAYVVWEGGSSAVSALARGAAGTLALLPGKETCVAEPALKATCAVGQGLGGAVGLAVSPDGRNVYVAATRTSSVASFARSG